MIIVYTQYNKITDGGIIIPDCYTLTLDNIWITYNGRKEYNILMPYRDMVSWVVSMSEEERNKRGCYTLDVDITKPKEDFDDGVNRIMWHMIVDNNDEKEITDESIKSLEKEIRINFIKCFLKNNPHIHCMFDEIRDWLKNNTNRIMPDDNYYDVVFLRHIYEIGQYGEEYKELYNNVCSVLKTMFESTEHVTFEKSLNNDHNYGKPRGIILVHPDVVETLKK